MENDERLLDNVIWHALSGNQQHFSLGGSSAKRYGADIVPFAAFPDSDVHTPDLAALAKLMTKGEMVLTIDHPVSMESGFVVHLVPSVRQYVYWDTSAAKPVDVEPWIELKASDVPEMIALVQLTNPGPLLRRMIDMGRYIGIRLDGNLVSMAGERMYAGRYREISGVCTHPDYVGRGFATQLVSQLIYDIVNRGEVPHLHVSIEKQNAISLYEKLGFKYRRELGIQFLEFVGLQKP